MSEKVLTIERFILDNQPDYARGEFTNLLYDIALTAKIIFTQNQPCWANRYPGHGWRYKCARGSSAKA